MRSIVMLH